MNQAQKNKYYMFPLFCGFYYCKTIYMHTEGARGRLGKEGDYWRPSEDGKRSKEEKKGMRILQNTFHS